MNGVSFDVYSLDRAYELAAAASYAKVRSGFGDGQSAFKRNHVDCLDGAVLGTCSATGAVNIHNANVLVEYYAARLGFVFLLNRKRLDGTGGTYLAAQVAVIVAVTLVKLHDRLHNAAQSVLHACRFKHVRRTLAYAEMA